MKDFGKQFSANLFTMGIIYQMIWLEYELKYFPFTCSPALLLIEVLSIIFMSVLLLLYQTLNPEKIHKPICL